MAIDNPEIVDVVSVDHRYGCVVLDISDHYDWTNEQEHLKMLQKKVNAYVQFIKSGQLVDVYPDALGKSPVIHVACYYSPSHTAKTFFDEAAPCLEAEGIRLTYKQSNFNSREI